MSYHVPTAKLIYIAAGGAATSAATAIAASAFHWDVIIASLIGAVPGTAAVIISLWIKTTVTGVDQRVGEVNRKVDGLLSTQTQKLHETTISLGHAEGKMEGMKEGLASSVHDAPPSSPAVEATPAGDRASVTLSAPVDIKVVEKKEK